VRSFTLEIRHVAFAINLFFGMILGRQAQLLVAEMGPNQSRPLFGDGPQSALAVLRDLSILLPVVIVIVPQCVGDRILHTICCSRTMDLGLHIAVHARKKIFLRHTVRPSRKGPPQRAPSAGMKLSSESRNRIDGKILSLRSRTRVPCKRHSSRLLRSLLRCFGAFFQ
jgi:hypothetical protein